MTPPLTHADLWYSYNDNNPPTPLGTPCPAYYTTDPPGTCPQLFPEMGPGGGVGPHGAAPYHFDPKNPNPTKFPAYYDGSIFFGEFTRDYLREIKLDSQGHIFKINDLLTCGDASADRNAKPFTCDAPMDMRWGPDGDFYLLSYGDGFFRANPDALLVKFSYVKGTRAPTAKLAADVTNGQAPLAVNFSSEGSSDPDPGDSIKFAWDFDGNGTTDSTDPNPTFTYTTNGVYTAKLTVADSSGKTATANTTIEVGNTAPTVKITTPADGGFFNWGDPIPWTVTVTDPEESSIDCSKVTLSFALGHDNHGHGESTQTGCSGVYQTDPADATHASGYLYGGLTASYTDRGAGGQPPLTSIDQRVIQQKRQQLEYATDQSGTRTALTTDPEGGDSDRTSINPGDWVVPRRTGDPDHASRRGPAARPGGRQDHGHRHHPGLQPRRGRAVRRCDRPELRDRPLGLPLLRAPAGHAADELPDEQHRPARVGRLQGLQPVVAVQVRRDADPASRHVQ